MASPGHNELIEHAISQAVIAYSKPAHLILIIIIHFKPYKQNLPCKIKKIKINGVYHPVGHCWSHIFEFEDWEVAGLSTGGGAFH